jgi:hypothetical protein
VWRSGCLRPVKPGEMPELTACVTRAAFPSWTSEAADDVTRKADDRRLTEALNAERPHGLAAHGDEPSHSDSSGRQSRRTVAAPARTGATAAGWSTALPHAAPKGVFPGQGRFCSRCVVPSVCVSAGV